jgi:hypothetical protein
MLKTALTHLTAVLVLATAGVVSAAQTQTQKPVETPAVAQQPQRPTGQLANIRLDLSITDQRGETPATPKIVTMIVADRETGRIRTGRGNLNLNVDARPDLPREGRVRVFLTLEYRPQAILAAGGASTEEPMAISESLTVILEEGKPLVVSQSADPASDRKVRVELKATVMR